MEKVAPYWYIHVLDTNSNVTRVVEGPTTYAVQDHEKISYGPAEMIVIPPRHYCVIKDPAVRDEDSLAPETDEFGQIKLRHGDREIRFAETWKEPFPLLPGEHLEGSVTQMPFVEEDTALRLTAAREFSEGQGDAEILRVPGDEWLFHGPATYRPRIETEVLETLVATVIMPDHALKLRARRETRDCAGVKRKAGEEWLIRQPGSYLPGADEDIVAVQTPHVLTQTKALHLEASDTFTDVYGVKRNAGEEWLVTNDMAELHVLGVYEKKVKLVDITVLTALQFCIVLDPMGADGKNQYGSRVLKRGPQSFFLRPGEKLERGLQEVYVLGEEEALLLKAKETFTDSVDGKDVKRTPGDLWMVTGPSHFVPSLEMEVVEQRSAIPLDENEGIYVRDVTTGRVRAVRGETYMLKSYEERWEKELSDEMEGLLNWSYYKGFDNDDDDEVEPRDKTKMVVFRVPHNAAVQVYDYKQKKARVVFGPGLVMLEPDEEFTINRLSGDKPKRSNVIVSLALLLGPDFMTDIVEVETSDHARLRLQLSYNWHFDILRSGAGSEEQAAKLFQVRDFVGDCCKAIASRIRGAVASTTFDEFHKFSARMIRSAVFGVDAETGRVNESFMFTANRLVITNIDIQSVEPVDQRTRESLQKSVQLAIEITTRKQERNARHQAQEIEQNAKGKIARQKIENDRNSEAERHTLIALKAESAALQSTGTAKAEAEAKAEYMEIESTADVERAKLSAQASAIEAEAQLLEIKAKQELDVTHQVALSALEVKKNQRLADIEAKKFSDIVGAIGPKVIESIAQAGPETQARLLKSLGLKGYLLTDGSTPVNLFDAAKGMIGGANKGGAGAGDAAAAAAGGN